MSERSEMASVILASSSSRRREWLTSLFEKSGKILGFYDLENSEPAPISGREVSIQTLDSCMHKAKVASSVIEQEFSDSASYVVVSDTLVEDPDDQLVALGKPPDPVSAASSLIRLSGRRHRVWSSTGILQKGGGDVKLDDGWMVKIWTDYSIVEFDEIEFSLMNELIDSESWVGKAGGYDIAGMAGKFSRVVQGKDVTVLGFAPKAIDSIIKIAH